LKKNKSKPYHDTKSDVLVTVSELYYKDGRTQQDIAERLGISRATVINYLKRSRDQGLVEIKIKGSAYQGSKLVNELRQKYSLKEVYITNTDHKRTSHEAHLSTARLAAKALEGLLKNRDIIGVAWGRTIQLVSQEISQQGFQSLTICQITGSVISDDLISAEASAIRFAENLNGRCHTLHAPAIMSEVDLAQRLRQEPVVYDQLERLKKLNKVIFSVGGIDLADPVRIKMATDKELTRFRNHGAKAVLCGHILDTNGEHIEHDFSRRIIGMRPNEIRSVPYRICVASQHHDASAVRAALTGGYATHLVIDKSLARLL
jgi:DNA-binding transcriptional regulator LsrR (DeoR family)